MKKLLSVLLAVILCISVCSVAVFAADTEVELSVTADKTTVGRGDTVTVVVDMSKNTKGISSMMIDVAFDEDVLQVAANGPVKQIKKEDFYTADPTYGFEIKNFAADNTKGNPLIFAWAYTCDADYQNYYQDFKGTSKLVTITFKVKDDAAFGTSAITVGYSEKGYPSSFDGTKRVVSKELATWNITVACTNHNYNEEIKDANHLKTAAGNCSESNVYWYDCSNCDANAKNDANATDKYYTTTETGDHSFTEKITDDAHLVAGTGADCQDAKEYYYDCAYCDEIGTTTWVSTVCGDHNFTEKITDDAHLVAGTGANCQDVKEYYYDCALCDKIGTTSWASTIYGDHSFTEKISDDTHFVAGTGANCQDAKKYYYDCAHCDEIGTTTWVSTTYGDHQFNTAEWGYKDKATGHAHKCNFCDAHDTVQPHTPNMAAPTEDDDKICSACSIVLEPSTGHICQNHLTPVSQLKATCTDDGYKAHYECSCGKYYEDSAALVEIANINTWKKGNGKIAATDHDYGDWHYADDSKKPTCTKDGELQRVCANNAAHVETMLDPAFGHTPDPDGWTIIDYPTLTEEGERQGVCEECGDTLEKETMPKLTNVVEKDKVISQVLDKNGKVIEDATVDAKFEVTGDEPLSGYVEGYIVKQEAPADIDKVDGNTIIEGYMATLMDTDIDEVVADTEVKVTIKLSDDLLAKYENLVLYNMVYDDATDEASYVALTGGEIVDGAIVFTVNTDDLTDMFIVVAGTEIVVDAPAGDVESPNTGDSSLVIAFAIVMMAIAAAALVISRKEVRA